MIEINSRRDGTLTRVTVSCESLEQVSHFRAIFAGSTTRCVDVRPDFVVTTLCSTADARIIVERCEMRRRSIRKKTLSARAPTNPRGLSRAEVMAAVERAEARARQTRNNQ